jgi:hypothetical protein
VSVVVLVPLLLVIHNRRSSPASDPITVVTSAGPQRNSAVVAAPVRTARPPAKKEHAPAPEQQAESTTSASPQDPAELWKDVRGGSARAEVTLARLYLEGNTVPQSCEQTHMLLLAASKKGYKAADSLLAGAYLQRCQPR